MQGQFFGEKLRSNKLECIRIAIKFYGMQKYIWSLEEEK